MLVDEDETVFIDGYLYLRLEPGQSFIFTMADSRTFASKATIHHRTFVYCAEDAGNLSVVDVDPILYAETALSESWMTLCGRDYCKFGVT